MASRIAGITVEIGGDTTPLCGEDLLLDFWLYKCYDKTDNRC